MGAIRHSLPHLVRHAVLLLVAHTLAWGFEYMNASVPQYFLLSTETLLTNQHDHEGMVKRNQEEL